MNNHSLISVIIPFLNVGSFIEETIESVLAQSYTELELLLVDDGSTDSGTQIALRYAERYPQKICYLEHYGHQNRGTSATRNLGLSKAKGEYVAFLDADDVWLPHKLERQMEILASQPEAAMVYGPSQKWFSWTGRPEDAQRDFIYELGIQPRVLMKPPSLLALCLERKAITPCPSNILMRREVVERIGGFEESFCGMYQHCEDQAFLAKVYINASVYVSDECWDRYRQHPESTTARTKKAGDGYYVWQFYLNWLEEYLSQKGVKDKSVWKALEKELMPYRHATRLRLQTSARKSLAEINSVLRLIAHHVVPASIRRRLRENIE